MIRSKTDQTITILVPSYPVITEAAVGRFRDHPEDTIPVTQHVVLGDRIVVASAYGDGYWWIPADPSLRREGVVPRAVFEPDPDASFTYKPTR